jgi:hypothetical protein
VRGVLLDHLEDRVEHTDDCPEWAVSLIGTAETVEVAKQLVRAVDDVDDHVTERRIPHSGCLISTRA